MSLLNVYKGAPALVSPSRATPCGHAPLSDFDRMPVLRHFVEVIIVFDHGNKPAEVVRRALAEALVPYYPVAGRIVDGIDDGNVGVACTGEGVWLVEASTDCLLEDVDYLKQEPLLIPKEQLLPSPPKQVDELALPIMLQVTEFKCGGCAVGIKFNHAIFDGKGVGQFIVAIGEMARGLVEPTVAPVWCRDVIFNPVPNFPSFDRLHQLIDDRIKLLLSVIDIPLGRIEQQKDGFEKETGQKCTTFDVVAAKLWQSRTRAIELGRGDNGVVVAFGTPVSIHHLHDELPADQGRGYYGNCIYPLVIEAPCGEVANGSFFDVVKMVREAKESLPTKYSRSLKGVELPEMLAPTYRNLTLVDRRRLGFNEADFGWGKPKHVVPLTEQESRSVVAYIIDSPADQHIRVMAHCVTKEHQEAFLRETNKWP
ncbi:acyl transferase 5-like [Iris pallida]|uniref:Acyl transferase 5-like n=1 Tax=Iris pallida TaxID=29817 RepID=A0AAX6HFA1_IRIPA|nr:acyl transferase 5-like [Iris pallida]